VSLQAPEQGLAMRVEQDAGVNDQEQVEQLRCTLASALTLTTTCQQ
jgi:hypothetical protein